MLSGLTDGQPLRAPLRCSAVDSRIVEGEATACAVRVCSGASRHATSCSEWERACETAGHASLRAFWWWSTAAEDEFKAIYAAQKSLREGSVDADLTPAQRHEQYEARLAAALGPERALDLLELGKAGSDRLPLLISRLDLPLSTIGSVNAVKNDIGQRAQAVSNDTSLTATQREFSMPVMSRTSAGRKRRLPHPFSKTVTSDNATEFARHYDLHALGIQTFFCDAHAPWQKGGIENAIGRMRRFLPRKTDLASLDDTRFLTLVAAYNDTPRKCLDWLTPAEAFSNHLLHFERESTFPPSRE